MSNLNKLFKLLIEMNPKIKFERRLKLMDSGSITVELEFMLCEERRKLFNKGIWNKELEDKCLNTVSNIDYYNAYNKVNNVDYKNNFSIFLTFFK